MTPVDSKQGRSITWPKIRAFLIALAIAVGLIDGAPIPTPRVMQHLPSSLQTLSLRLYDIQAFLLAPFRPIKDTFGINLLNQTDLTKVVVKE